MRHPLRFSLLSLVVAFLGVACLDDSPTPPEMDQFEVSFSIEGSCPADFVLIESERREDRNGDGYYCKKQIEQCTEGGKDGVRKCFSIIIRIDNNASKAGECLDGYAEVPAHNAPDADVNGDDIVCELETDDGFEYTDNNQ